MFDISIAELIIMFFYRINIICFTAKYPNMLARGAGKIAKKS